MQVMTYLMFFQPDDTTEPLLAWSRVCFAMAVKPLRILVTGTATHAMMEHGATAMSAFNKANTALIPSNR